MLASGPEDALERRAPSCAPVADQVVELGPAGNGSRMKMVDDSWIMAGLAGVAETMALAEALDVVGDDLRSSRAGRVDAGSAQSKGGAVARAISGELLPLQLARKDAGLVRRRRRRATGLDPAGGGAASPPRGCGHGDADMAAAYERRARSPQAGS